MWGKLCSQNGPSQNLVSSEEQDIAVFKHVTLKNNLKLCQSEIKSLTASSSEFVTGLEIKKA